MDLVSNSSTFCAVVCRLFHTSQTFVVNMLCDGGNLNVIKFDGYTFDSSNHENDTLETCTLKTCNKIIQALVFCLYLLGSRRTGVNLTIFPNYACDEECLSLLILPLPFRKLMTYCVARSTVMILP